MKTHYEHILRFTLVDKEQLAMENVNTGKTSPLLALPNEILQIVFSFLNGKDLLNFFAVKPSWAADCRLTTKFVKISPSLDSIRLCMMSIPNSVEEVTITSTVVASAQLRDIMGNLCWKKILSSPRLKKLTTDDVSMLREVQLSSTLTKVRITNNKLECCAMQEIDMSGIHLFPSSVCKLEMVFESHNRSFRAYDYKPPSNGLPSGKLFFDISHNFPALTSIRMNPSPCKEFWGTVDQDFLGNIAHLFLDDFEYDDCFFPFSLTKNLKTLVFGGRLTYGFQDAVPELMKDASLPFLTAFEYRYNDHSTKRPANSFLVPLLRAAPAVKYISLTFANFDCLSQADQDVMQRFHYFRVHHFMLQEDIQFLFWLIPRVKCVDVLCHIDVRIDELGVKHAVDDAVLSVEAEAMKVGGHVKILYDPRHPHFFHGKLRACVRVICDTKFDYRKIFDDHPPFSQLYA